uniref:Uncharacterized protein n=1 Tax=Brassica oleracea TaxID=3712 RepID=A0A3P6DJ99_BRAOL|nr:unnamed protein product [Brassica oleracea]
MLYFSLHPSTTFTPITKTEPICRDPSISGISGELSASVTSTDFGLSTSTIRSKEGVEESTDLRGSLSLFFLDLTLLPMEDRSRGWLGSSLILEVENRE